MRQAFVSIVIPVYNGSRTIECCLDSVFKTTYPFYECIVVDDNSSDETPDIAESFDVKLIRLQGRKGAAHARNLGTEAAWGDILMFLDSDVMLYPDSLDKVVRAFEDHPKISALFGSYDDEPGCSNFFSQYKNLFHHYIHQNSREEASTFWTGCGAVKKEPYFKVGRFNENVRMMEDIDLGYRLKAANYRILLVKNLVVKHLKHYTLFTLLKSDFCDRAIPWTYLMFVHNRFTRDLNLKLREKVSTILSFLIVITICMGTISQWFILGSLLIFSLFLVLNYRLYSFFLNKRGLLFALKALPIHLLYYIYSAIGFIVASLQYYFYRSPPS